MTDFFEHIDQYKQGALKGETLQAFEAELKINTGLRKAVDNHDVVEELFDLMWEDEIRRVMVEGGEPVSTDADVIELNQAKHKTAGIAKWLKIAASLLLVAAIAFLISQQLSTLSPEELYAKHYSPFIETNITRGEQGTPTNLSPCELGHYYLDDGQFELAVQIFEDDLRNEQSDCHERSEWYLTLFHLKYDNYTQRDNLLTNILKNTNHTYYQKALKLQADLE